MDCRCHPPSLTLKACSLDDRMITETDDDFRCNVNVSFKLYEKDMFDLD